MLETIFGLATLCLLSAAPVKAHRGLAHLRGTVAEITADHIVVKLADGDAGEADITPSTRFVRGKSAAKAEDVKRGERVVVRTFKHGDVLDALEIQTNARK